MKLVYGKSIRKDGSNILSKTLRIIQDKRKDIVKIFGGLQARRCESRPSQRSFRGVSRVRNEKY